MDDHQFQAGTEPLSAILFGALAIIRDAIHSRETFVTKFCGSDLESGERRDLNHYCEGSMSRIAGIEGRPNLGPESSSYTYQRFLCWIRDA